MISNGLKKLYAVDIMLEFDKSYKVRLKAIKGNHKQSNFSFLAQSTKLEYLE